MSVDLEQLLRAAIAADAAWRIYMDAQEHYDGPSQVRDDLRVAWQGAEMELAHRLDAPQ